MSSWQDAYTIGEQIEAKVGDKWLPGTVLRKTADLGITCRLKDGDFIAGESNQIRKPVKAAAAPKPGPKDAKGPPA